MRSKPSPAFFARRALLVAAALWGMGVSASAQAGAYPDHPIRLVVGFSPGGGSDVAARVIQQRLQDELKQTIVIDNRPGANGNIATEQLARAESDGYTLMLATVGQMAVNPYLLDRVSYDPEHDFTPIAELTSSSLTLVVPGTSDIHSVADLIAKARKNPGGLSYGSGGVGGSMHIGAEMLNTLAKLRTTHVPYKGTSPAAADLVAGRLDYMISSTSDIVGYLHSGQLRAIATTGDRPNPAYPQMPLIADTVPGFRLTTWLGLFGPKDLPAPVVARLAAAMKQAADDPAIQERFVGLGSGIYYRGPREFAEFLDQDRQRARRVIDSAHLRENQ